MKNKKFYFIVVFLIISIVVVFSYIFINVNLKNGNNHYKQYDKILKSEDKTICTVNNEVITDKDILLVKYYDSDNANKAEEQAIEDKVILQRLEENDFKLNEKNDTHIQDLIYGLKNNENMKNHYSEEERKELIETISKKLYDDALINQFKAEFISKLADRIFSSDNEEISKKYSECLVIQDKWDNKQGVAYGTLTEAREAVYKAYVQNLIDNSVIE